MQSNRPRRLQAWMVLCALLGCLLPGCIRTRGDVELIEARLRDQQDLAFRYERLLQSSRDELDLARRESDLLRQQIAAANAQPLLPEHADVLLRAEKLAFHGLMTGARDTDGRPGDDELTVVIMPQANSGEVIRLIGEVEVTALDLSRPAGSQQIGEWRFTPQQARDNWHAGFLASGYQFDLPLQESPQSSELVLHARLRAPDGRELTASQPLKVQAPVMQASATTTTNALPDVPGPPVEPRLLPPLNDAEPAAALPMSEPPIAQATPPATPERLVPPPQDAGTPPPFPVASSPALPPRSESPPSAASATEPSPPISIVPQPASPPAAEPAIWPVVAPRGTAQKPSATWGAEGPPRLPPTSAAGPVPPLTPVSRPRRDEDALPTAGRAAQPAPSAVTDDPFAAAVAGPAVNGPTAAPPFPEASPVQTSDNWTDESIPFLR